MGNGNSSVHRPYANYKVIEFKDDEEFTAYWKRRFGPEAEPTIGPILPKGILPSLEEQDSPDRLDGLIHSLKDMQIRGFDQDTNELSAGWHLTNAKLVIYLAVRYQWRGDVNDYIEAKSLRVKVAPKGKFPEVIGYDDWLALADWALRECVPLLQQLDHPQNDMVVNSAMPLFSTSASSNVAMPLVSLSPSTAGSNANNGIKEILAKVQFALPRFTWPNFISANTKPRDWVSHGPPPPSVKASLAKYQHTARQNTDPLHLLAQIAALQVRLADSLTKNIQEYTYLCSELAASFYASFLHSTNVTCFEEAFECAFTALFLSHYTDTSEFQTDRSSKTHQCRYVGSIIVGDYIRCYPLGTDRRWFKEWQKYEFCKLFRGLNNGGIDAYESIDSVVADFLREKSKGTNSKLDDEAALEGYQRIVDARTWDQQNIHPVRLLRFGTLLTMRYMKRCKSDDFHAADGILKEAVAANAGESVETLQVLGELHFFHGDYAGPQHWEEGEEGKAVGENYNQRAIELSVRLGFPKTLASLGLARFYIHRYSCEWDCNAGNLIAAYHVLYALTGEIEEHVCSIPEISWTLARLCESLALISSGGEERGDWEEQSLYWHRRYVDSTGQKEPLELTETEKLNSLEDSRKAAKSADNVPYLRLVQAHEWARRALEGDLVECLDAFALMSTLIDEAIWLGNRIEDKYRSLGRVHTFGASASAAALKFGKGPKVAVEYAEQSLSITTRQLLQLRGDRVSEVAKELPVLANRFQDLATTLQRLPQREGTPAEVPPATERTRIQQEYKDALEEIRAHPRFSSLFLPIRFSQLTEASRNGPVIILTSDHVTGDTHALILLHPTKEPLALQLPHAPYKELDFQRLEMRRLLSHNHGLQRRQSGNRAGKPSKWLVDDYSKGVEVVLEWIWDKILYPIFSELSKSGYESGRVWWCPVGNVIQLPLHAAAPLNSPYVSSYTYTLEGLISAPAAIIPQCGSTVKRVHMAAVAITNYPGRLYLSLPAARLEMQVLSDLVEDASKRFSDQKINLVKLEDGAANLEAVFQAIQSAHIVHLACHGIQDRTQPLASHLVLSNGQLQLKEILSEELPSAGFAFLSACQTAMGDAQFINEAAHLTGGFMAAGFKGVIGTLWSIADEDAPRVAREVYRAIITEEGVDITKAAEGFHRAVRMMREDDLPPYRWMPFIHVGV